jgi:acetoin utilization deacetylase AcuC-like enzyme
MRATARTRISTHEDCSAHLPTPGHPERPERLIAVVEGARQAGAESLPVEVGEERVLAAVERVHEAGYARRLRDACAEAPRIFDTPDNPVSVGSYRAAVAAVACSLAAVDTVLAGDADTVFVAVRPPGHHALRAKAMGYCFFNNVAVAAEEFLARGYGPVAIVDFDVHHGNGTQKHFWDRSDAFFLSVHRYPFYPGTGGADEIGSGRGRRFTRNFPLAAGADDETYTEAVAAGLEEILRAGKPGAWLVSAGFDAHREDPLGGMQVSDGGFGAIGAMLGQARRGSPLVAALEGGYRPEALQRSVRAFLTGVGGTASS